MEDISISFIFTNKVQSYFSASKLEIYSSASKVEIYFLVSRINALVYSSIVEARCTLSIRETWPNPVISLILESVSLHLF